MTGLVVAERERCVYVCDCSKNRIQRITLPPYLFITPPIVTSTAVSSVDVKSLPVSLTRSQIEAELKSVWDEITRIANVPRNVISVGAIGSNAANIQSMDSFFRRKLTSHALPLN